MIKKDGVPALSYKSFELNSDDFTGSTPQTITLFTPDPGYRAIVLGASAHVAQNFSGTSLTKVELQVGVSGATGDALANTQMDDVAHKIYGQQTMSVPAGTAVIATVTTEGAAPSAIEDGKHEIHLVYTLEPTITVS